MPLAAVSLALGVLIGASIGGWLGIFIMLAGLAGAAVLTAIFLPSHHSSPTNKWTLPESPSGTDAGEPPKAEPANYGSFSFRVHPSSAPQPSLVRDQLWAISGTRPSRSYYPTGPTTVKKMQYGVVYFLEKSAVEYVDGSSLDQPPVPTLLNVCIAVDGERRHDIFLQTHLTGPLSELKVGDEVSVAASPPIFPGDRDTWTIIVVWRCNKPLQQAAPLTIPQS